MLMQSLSSYSPLWEKWPLFVTGIPRRHFSSSPEVCGVHLKDLHPTLYRMGKWLHAWRTWTVVWRQVYGSWITIFWGENGHLPELLFMNYSSRELLFGTLKCQYISSTVHVSQTIRTFFYNCPIHSLKVSLREFANILSQNEHSEWIFCINSSTSLRKWSWCEKCKTMWPSFFSFATKCGKTSFSKVIFVLCL